jgi:hypothetical protein
MILILIHIKEYHLNKDELEKVVTENSFLKLAVKFPIDSLEAN